MTTYTTEQILKQFNIHELRVFARAHRIDEDYGRKVAKKATIGTEFEKDLDKSISEMPFNTLLEKIANRFNIVYTTDPNYSSETKLDTKFMLDKFNMPMLHGLVKQQTVQTIKVKGASKGELVEKLTPIFNFWLVGKSIDVYKPTYVPKPIEEEDTDIMVSKIKARINELKSEGQSKTKIVSLVKEELKKALEYSLSNTNPPLNEPNFFYPNIQTKKEELITAYVAPTRKRMNKDEEGNVKITDYDIKAKYITKELSAFVRKYVSMVPDLIDLKAEKLSTLQTIELEKLLAERKQEVREVQKQASEKQASKINKPEPEKGKRGRKLDTTKVGEVKEIKEMGRPRKNPTKEEKIEQWKLENGYVSYKKDELEQLPKSLREEYIVKAKQLQEYIDSLEKRKYVKRTEAEKDALAAKLKEEKQQAKLIKQIAKERKEQAKEDLKKQKEMEKLYKIKEPRVRKSKSKVSEPSTSQATEADDRAEFLALRAQLQTQVNNDVGRLVLPNISFEDYLKEGF